MYTPILATFVPNILSYSRIVGKIWKNLPESERARWRGFAEQEKKEHAEKYPNYKYSPNSRRDGAPPPVRTVPLRSSAARSRKAKPPTAAPTSDRTDDIAKVFLAGSRKESLTERVRDLDQKRQAQEELETSSKRNAPALSIRVPPRSELIDIEPSCTPQSSPALPASSCGPLTSDSAPTSNEGHATFARAQPSPLSDIHIDDDSAWSLAACSAPLSDPEFSFESGASLPTSPHQSYDSDTSPSWPFRVGFDGGETLNRIAVGFLCLCSSIDSNCFSFLFFSSRARSQLKDMACGTTRPTTGACISSHLPHLVPQSSIPSRPSLNFPRLTASHWKEPRQDIPARLPSTFQTGTGRFKRLLLTQRAPPSMMRCLLMTHSPTSLGLRDLFPPNTTIHHPMLTSMRRRSWARSALFGIVGCSPSGATPNPLLFPRAPTLSLRHHRAPRVVYHPRR